MRSVDRGQGICTVDGVLGARDCDAWLDLADSLGYTAAPITTAFGFEMRPDIRNNARVILDNVDRAHALWKRLGPAMPAGRPGTASVGLNERFRVYRYTPGQYFQWHRDGSYRRNEQEWSTMTALVYLNDTYEGGRTEIAGVGAIEPHRGRALVFPHHLRHRGAPVDTGTKYVLRTDVMVRSAV